MSNSNDMFYKYISVTIGLFLALYGSLGKFELKDSSMIKYLFKHYLFRLAILSFIAFRANDDPQTSILIAIAFISTMNSLTEAEAKETFTQLEHFREIEHFYNDESN